MNHFYIIFWNVQIEFGRLWKLSHFIRLWSIFAPLALFPPSFFFSSFPLSLYFLSLFFLCLSICNTLTSVRFTFASAKTQWYAFNFELFTLVYSVKTPFKLNTFSTQSICFGFEIQCRKKPLNALNWERKKYFYDIKTSINRTRGSERERERDTHTRYTGWAFRERNQRMVKWWTSTELRLCE